MSEDTRHTLSPLFGWRGALCDSDLHPTTRYVAFALSLHMNERGGSCFPSIATIARDSGLHERTVQEHLRILRSTGWLSVTYGGGRGRSNRYSASLPKGWSWTPDSPERVVLTAIKGGPGPPEDVIRTTRSARVSDSSFQVRPDFTQRGGCSTCTQGWIETEAGLKRCPDQCWA